MLLTKFYNLFIIMLFVLYIRGGLRYPSKKFIYFLDMAAKFSIRAILLLHRQLLLEQLLTFILPRFREEFACKQCTNPVLLRVILQKFLRPLLDNYAKKETDTVKGPAFRKKHFVGNT